MRYQSRVTSDDLKVEVTDLLESLKTDTNLRQEVADAGINLDELDRTLRDQKAEDVITIEPDGAGVDPATVAIIVAFAPVAARVTQDLWTHFMLPWLKRKFGTNAITPLEDKTR
jgi:integral membrane sensor domain MASE1